MLFGLGWVLFGLGCLGWVVSGWVGLCPLGLGCVRLGWLCGARLSDARAPQQRRAGRRAGDREALSLDAGASSDDDGGPAVAPPAPAPQQEAVLAVFTELRIVGGTTAVAADLHASMQPPSALPGVKAKRRFYSAKEKAAAVEAASSILGSSRRSESRGSESRGSERRSESRGSERTSVYVLCCTLGPSVALWVLN